MVEGSTIPRNNTWGLIFFVVIPNLKKHNNNFPTFKYLKKSMVEHNLGKKQKNPHGWTSPPLTGRIFVGRISFSGPMKPTTPESSGVDTVLIHFFPGGHAVLPSRNPAITSLIYGKDPTRKQGFEIHPRWLFGISEASNSAVPKKQHQHLRWNMKPST